MALTEVREKLQKYLDQTISLQDLQFWSDVMVWERLYGSDQNSISILRKLDVMLFANSIYNNESALREKIKNLLPPVCDKCGKIPSVVRNFDDELEWHHCCE